MARGSCLAQGWRSVRRAGERESELSLHNAGVLAGAVVLAETLGFRLVPGGLVCSRRERLCIAALLS